MPTEKILLNIAQKKAVEFTQGPLLVVAGAGTGKTRVITQRIRHLIQNNSVRPKQVLALTFTEKASGEMLARLGDAMPLGYEEPWVYTFHSFADRLLREEGLEIGLNPGYKIMSSSEQWLLFRKHLFKFDLNYFRPLGNPTKFVSAIISFISRLQDENISSEELQTFAANFTGLSEEKIRWTELATIYKQYEELKLAQSKMDFGDLITWVIKLFSDRPAILKKYQDQFQHVLLDEFQDTNYAQYELVKLLCPQNMLNRTLLAVGDDSQSIYKFRGAAISNILQFKEDYPGVEMISLNENYRSNQVILDSSYKLIQHNNPDTLEFKLGISKKLTASSTVASDKPIAVQLTTLEAEVEFVISEILKLLAQEPKLTFKDVAIMARANSHLDPFVLALRKYGLPYQLVGNRGLYDRDEIRDVISLIKIIINPADSVSLYRALNIFSFNISADVIVKILSAARYNKVSLWEIVSTHKDLQIQAFYTRITAFQKDITKESPSQFIYKMVSEINYLMQFTQQETVENNLSIKNLDLFLTSVKKFEVNYRNENKEVPTIIDFAEHLDLLIEANDNPAQAEIEDIDTINLLTIHASKGLEFPVVFMVNLVGDRFPTRNRRDAIELPDMLIKETLPIGDAHLQEERRLFYVGMTRAMQHLYLVCAKNYGGKRDKVPSGYIEETGIKLESTDSKLKDNTQLGLFGLESGFRDAAARKVKTFEPAFLSYSQINTYKTCPLQYKYSYILGIPTAPNHVFSFGNSIHGALQDFHSLLSFEKQVSLETLYSAYTKRWDPLGYMDEDHRKLRFEEGKVLLKNYFEKNKSLQVKHIALEKGFNLHISGIKFYGKIDRIDRLEDGSIEIIDYKTGSPKDQKFVDADDQVTYYALGVKEALGLDATKLSYYFLEGGEKVSTTRGPQDFEEKKQEVKEVVSKMQAGDFSATPGKHCDWCAYNKLCPYAFKG